MGVGTRRYVGWIVLQHLSLPHHLVAQFSPVKTGEGGMHKKLCLKWKCTLCIWTNIDLEGLSEQLFSFVLRKVYGDLMAVQINTCIMGRWEAQANADILILRVEDVFLPWGKLRICNSFWFLQNSAEFWNSESSATLQIRLSLLLCNYSWQGTGQFLGTSHIVKSLYWVSAWNSHSCL